MVDNLAAYYLNLGANSESQASPAKNVSPTIVELKAQNSEQLVNKLPPEVLADIFAIGEQWERRTWRAKRHPVPFQQISAQVCTHWRHVAVNTTILWTYIRISDAPYDQLVPLFLSRTGPLALLDIDLGAYSGPFPLRLGGNKQDVEHILHALDILIRHGATPDRWRSLLISSEDHKTLPPLIYFLNSISAPKLRFLAIIMTRSAWYRNFHTGATERETPTNPSPYTLMQTSLPGLRGLELITVSRSCVARQAPLLYEGLTSLVISYAGTLGSISDIHKVLTASPRLKTLVLRTGLVSSITNIEANEISPNLQVILPELEALGFSADPCCLSWTRRIVQLISAPALHSFRFACPRMVGYQAKRLLRYITTGRVMRSSPMSRPNLPNNPIYPSLRGLDVSRFPCAEKYLGRLFSAFPSITELHIRGTQVPWLSKSPLLLPKLTLLFVTEPPYPCLADLLTRRADRGTPVKMLHVQSLQWKAYKSLPDSVEIFTPLDRDPKHEDYDYHDETLTKYYERRYQAEQGGDGAHPIEWDESSDGTCEDYDPDFDEGPIGSWDV